jgi:hypothetical protein
MPKRYLSTSVNTIRFFTIEMSLLPVFFIGGASHQHQPEKEMMEDNYSSSEHIAPAFILQTCRFFEKPPNNQTENE